MPCEAAGGSSIIRRAISPLFYSATLPVLLTCGDVTQSHLFLQEDARRDVDLGEWIARALQWRDEQKQQRRSRQQEEQLHPTDTLRPSKLS
jgi:hypothetical protein